MSDKSGAVKFEPQQIEGLHIIYNSGLSQGFQFNNVSLAFKEDDCGGIMTVYVGKSEDKATVTVTFSTWAKTTEDGYSNFVLVAKNRHGQVVFNHTISNHITCKDDSYSTSPYVFCKIIKTDIPVGKIHALAVWSSATLDNDF